MTTQSDASRAARLWRATPHSVRSRALRARRWWRRSSPSGRVRWGNLRSRAPLSVDFALDRGLPVDRAYITEFLGVHAQDIHGSVMEMSRSMYADSIGGARVRSVAIVDIDRDNKQATYHCDLCVAASLPTDEFDCIVLTQTLQYLRDLDVAIENLWQALRPGGTLLLTAPALSRDDPLGNDYWRFTPAGLEVLLTRHLPEGTDIEVVGYGNAVAAAAQIVAASVEDLGVEHLAPNDPAYPVIVAARVRRPR